MTLQIKSGQIKSKPLSRMSEVIVGVYSGFGQNAGWNSGPGISGLLIPRTLSRACQHRGPGSALTPCEPFPGSLSRGAHAGAPRGSMETRGQQGLLLKKEIHLSQGKPQTETFPKVSLEHRETLKTGTDENSEAGNDPFSALRPNEASLCHKAP